jgi:drug/metabolite transporter (DMT)-like permease
MSRRGWILFATLSLLWGVPYLLIKIAVADLSPVAVALGRTLIGALLLLPFALRAGALGPALQRWKWVAAFAVVEIAGPWLLLGYAELRLTSGATGLLVAVVPLLTAILQLVGGAERLSPLRAAGLMLGFLGVAALVGLDFGAADLVSVGAVLLAATGYAIGPLIMSRRLADAPPLGVVTLSLLCASAFYAPAALAGGPVSGGAQAWLAVAALGVACTAIAFLLFFGLVAEAGPARATVITYLNPAVAILAGAAVLGEPMTPGMTLGFALIAIGSFLATRRDVPASA